MNSRAKLFIPIGVFSVLLGLMYTGLGGNPGEVTSAMIERPVLDYSMPDLIDESLQHSASELKGDIFLVNFWASWCAPCVIEHPFLMELSQNEDITLVGVNWREPERNNAMDFMEERGNPFEYIIADVDGRLGVGFGVTGPPETFLVDNHGIIRHRHISVLDANEWERTFKPIIEQIRLEESRQ
jgi:cytochrome c biogenesis protein CcmG, thiol:disulfide interchange protein DsbE